MTEAAKDCVDPLAYWEARLLGCSEEEARTAFRYEGVLVVTVDMLPEPAAQ
jgi:hypothetical protein